ncbi:hypothetical protein BIFCAT_01508 [Bifidobacterium catenulatum DSM 16992 = JCM 1194 = LMG 11043]|uniref:Uncharacterized protein n=2 Tax=Bifidobacterium TaxID=1678 RepID=B6XWT0_9BIFI|nr:hypothetical protein BIFCAT_01508 [Bifidobacterium catenulatum DSM 16992 = JCM 1194 = LMG 11043]EEG71709.1 hypothetical protein BIFPSEUDO_02592 [Bifidobacterium pseudocatenulatum DSM 20438 = JCM 1200 = LMG 10505]
MLQDVPALERQALPRMPREQQEWREAQEWAKPRGQPASWPGPQASWIQMRCSARWKRKHSSAYGQPEVQR